MKPLVSSKFNKSPMGFIDIPPRRGEDNEFLEVYDYDVADGGF